MTQQSPHNIQAKDLLLSPFLTPGKIHTFLRQYGFENPKQACENMQLMANDPESKKLLADCINEILGSVSLSIDPDLTLSYFERFVKAFAKQCHDNKILYRTFMTNPHTREILVKVFGSSPFMSQILIRYPFLFFFLLEPNFFLHKRTKTQLRRKCAEMVDPRDTETQKLDALRVFKKQEMLRIGIKDLMQPTSVRKTTAALSILAEVIIENVYQICNTRLQAQHGCPQHRSNTGKTVATRFAILAMGKLGGKELNFSSDVDLMYVFESENGLTQSGNIANTTSQIPNSEYFRYLAQSITTVLNEVTHEGYLFRVDLNLRPEGKEGAIATSLEAYHRYYTTRGETWERMALLKAYPIAGSRPLGQRFFSTIDSFVYNTPFTTTEFEEVKKIKTRINKKLVKLHPHDRNIKLGIGGIREIEFIVQSLQLAYGKKYQNLYDRHTISGLRKLYCHTLLSAHDYKNLRSAYIFYRNVEHKLQMVEDLQTHTLPTNPKELQRCALMAGYRDTENNSAANQLKLEDKAHAERVNKVFRTLSL